MFSSRQHTEKIKDHLFLDYPTTGTVRMDGLQRITTGLPADYRRITGGLPGRDLYRPGAAPLAGTSSVS
jgi:hypothetical protein